MVIALVFAATLSMPVRPLAMVTTTVDPRVERYNKEARQRREHLPWYAWLVIAVAGIILAAIIRRMPVYVYKSGIPWLDGVSKKNQKP